MDSDRPGVAAVLFDRDGTLVRDVPYNADPASVSIMPTARQAVRTLRDRGIRIGLISNQSGIGRGILTHHDVAAVNRRIEEYLGAFDVCRYCPHTPQDGCDCRKPAPGLVLQACEQLGVAPSEVVVVGDIESDLQAAAAAGARGVLVPTAQTRRDEVARAGAVAPDLIAAVAAILAGHRQAVTG